jgi:hypothetical protein
LLCYCIYQNLMQLYVFDAIKQLFVNLKYLGCIISSYLLIEKLSNYLNLMGFESEYLLPLLI